MRYTLPLLLAAFFVSPAVAQVDAPPGSAEIVDFRWYKEPDFGVDGAVRWSVQVANDSRRTIYHAEVELTTYDESGTPLTTDLGIVEQIAPGDTAATVTRADLYGPEEKAKVRLTNVYWTE